MRNDEPWYQKFSVHEPGNAHLLEGGGVYAFASLSPGPGGLEWRPYYIGQAKAFSNRLNLPEHEKWEDAVELGATHVLVRDEPKQLRRGITEQVFIQVLEPPLNDQGT